VLSLEVKPQPGFGSGWRCNGDYCLDHSEVIHWVVELGLKAKQMTRTQGEPPKPISKAERNARKAFRQVDAKKAITEHELAQNAFSNNRERLKAERLAREAVGMPPTTPKTRKAKAK